jgi:hypothetical protein
MKNQVKFNKSKDKMLLPKCFYDIENIGEMLQEREMQIIVNLKEYEDSESINKIISFINSYNTSYACLRVRPIGKKGFLCWSEHK